jgi:hypothetical protein
MLMPARAKYPSGHCVWPPSHLRWHPSQQGIKPDRLRERPPLLLCGYARYRCSPVPQSLPESGPFLKPKAARAQDIELPGNSPRRTDDPPARAHLQARRAPGFSGWKMDLSQARKQRPLFIPPYVWERLHEKYRSADSSAARASCVKGWSMIPATRC